MSDTTDGIVQELISALPSIFWAYRAGLASMTVLAYEWIIMIPDEIRGVWKENFSSVTVLYLTTRYGTLFNWILSIVSFFIIGSNTSCVLTLQFTNATQLLVSISINVIFVLRTWAIFQRNKYILFTLLLLALAHIGTNISTIYAGEPSDFSGAPIPGVGGCGVDETPWFLKSYFANLSLDLAFSSVVFLLTLSRTLRASHHAKSLGIGHSLHSLLLQDGILYYAGITALDVADLISNQRTSQASDWNVIVAYLKSSLQPIIVCRLILNLKQVSHDDYGTATQQNSSNLPELEFATSRVLGSIGAPMMTVDSDPDPDVSSENRGDSQVAEA